MHMFTKAFDIKCIWLHSYKYLKDTKGINIQYFIQYYKNKQP